MCSFALPPQVLSAGWGWQLPLPSAIYFLILRDSEACTLVACATLGGSLSSQAPTDVQVQRKGRVSKLPLPMLFSMFPGPTHGTGSRDTGKLRLP